MGGGESQPEAWSHWREISSTPMRHGASGQMLEVLLELPMAAEVLKSTVPYSPQFSGKFNFANKTSETTPD